MATSSKNTPQVTKDPGLRQDQRDQPSTDIRDKTTHDERIDPTAGRIDPNDVELCDVEPDSLALVLRVALGLPPERPTLGEQAASRALTLPSVFLRVDAGALIAWCLAGVALFAEGFPTMKRLRAESGRVVLALAMLRTTGNISAAARVLHCSRKVLRDNLQRVGLYPWDEQARDPGEVGKGAHCDGPGEGEVDGG